MLRRGLTYPLPANAYLLKARKRIYTLTPIRPRFREKSGGARRARQTLATRRVVVVTRLNTKVAGTETVVEIYTDGACRGNPGPGGWGGVADFRRAVRRSWRARNHSRPTIAWSYGGDPCARGAEASVGALFTPTREYVRGASPSGYELEGSGWHTADRKPVKNQDLWERLDELAAGHKIEWRWVPGHAGVPGTSGSTASPMRPSTPWRRGHRHKDVSSKMLLNFCSCDRSFSIRKPRVSSRQLGHRIIEIGCVELVNRRVTGAHLPPLLESGA